jgi:hypothetical protein
MKSEIKKIGIYFRSDADKAAKGRVCRQYKLSYLIRDLNSHIVIFGDLSFWDMTLCRL